MLSQELVRKTRYIEILTRHLVNNTFAGRYHAVFKGHGIEFSEVRPYQEGDEVRMIDWNVSARTGSLYVKRHIEEKELTVMLVVDASASGEFGTFNRFKRELAAELASVLSLAATTSNDKVGLLMFTDIVELLIPPRKGRRHLTRLIRDMLSFQPNNKGTNIGVALETIARVLKRRSIVFLISDFIDDSKAYYKPLYLTNRRHDVVAIDLQDPMESEIPDIGIMALEDVELEELTWLDSSDASWRANFIQQQQLFEENKRQALLSAGVDRIQVKTNHEYMSELLLFFQKRSRRLAKTTRRATT